MSELLIPVTSRVRHRHHGIITAHLEEVAAAACECRSDLAVRKAANTQAQKQVC